MRNNQPVSRRKCCFTADATLKSMTDGVRCRARASAAPLPRSARTTGHRAATASQARNPGPDPQSERTKVEGGRKLVASAAPLNVAALAHRRSVRRLPCPENSSATAWAPRNTASASCACRKHAPSRPALAGPTCRAPSRALPRFDTAMPSHADPPGYRRSDDGLRQGSLRYPAVQSAA